MTSLSVGILPLRKEKPFTVTVILEQKNKQTLDATLELCDKNPHVSREKNTALLSLSWLFDRDPYVMVYEKNPPHNLVV